MLARLLVIGFGIAIIFPALIYNGVTTGYPAPKRTEFFPQFEMRPSPTAAVEERRAFEEQQRQRQEAFDAANRKFARVLLIVATVLGVAGILFGAALSAPASGVGLMLGGILSVGVGYFGYSNHLDDWWRFLSLSAGFAALLFVGHRQSR